MSRSQCKRKKARYQLRGGTVCTAAIHLVSEIVGVELAEFNVFFTFHVGLVIMFAHGELSVVSAGRKQRMSWHVCGTHREHVMPLVASAAPARRAGSFA